MTLSNCDGCARGLPVTNGLHRGPGGFWAGDTQRCTAALYAVCSGAEAAHNARIVDARVPRRDHDVEVAIISGKLSEAELTTYLNRCGITVERVYSDHGVPLVLRTTAQGSTQKREAGYAPDDPNPQNPETD